MAEYAIVAIGYNRPNSMIRLLNSLEKAEYENDDVTLIISIDNSGTDIVQRKAQEFDWTHGKKIIITYPERLGLRKHVLHCGEFLEDFRAVAVFEDDILPSPAFYQYMKQLVPFYENDENIAGISLYSHMWNVNVRYPFQPALSGYDVYFLQFAQSWGQIWMSRAWKEFIDWYSHNSEEFYNCDLLPEFVSGWPNSSWLKYHIRYCVEQNKWFVYPYQSFSTCFSDIGEHCRDKDTHLQIPYISMPLHDQLRLPTFGCREAVYYDVYFERNVSSIICNNYEYKDVSFDLYASKQKYGNHRYVVTTRMLPNQIIKSFALELRPHDMNVIFSVNGDEIKLYDLYENSHDKAVTMFDEISSFEYNFKLFSHRKLLVRYTLRLIKETIKTFMRINRK